MSEDEQGLEESDHHPFARVLHDHAGKEHKMVGAFGFSKSQSAAESIGLEQDIGIGEQQPVASGQVAGAPHGVRLAHPTRRQFCDVDDLEPARRRGGGNRSMISPVRSVERSSTAMTS